ncbi:hypothetical protein [Yoonia sp. 208BN28-4]|uniref:hypothetical protein n=1 Tax=Yoonia sp. 208BN28-4 TaxID=3126505 RepID=UPI00309FE344
MKILTISALMMSLVAAPAFAQEVEFGDDSGDWSNDNECDDPRFEGPGMTQTPLLFDDVNRDASDCATAFYAGEISQIGVGPDGTIDFGDDSSEWANDGECDDLRFVGEAMTDTPLLAGDIMRDATDCRMGYEVEMLFLR